jgi:methionyl-tRNA formyltransferase
MPFHTSTPPLPANFLLITASFGRILTPPMLGLFQTGRKLNVHPSLLPKYRGPAPIQWSILREEKETGVCVTEMLRKDEGEGIDGGSLWGIEKMVLCYPSTTTSR